MAYTTINKSTAHFNTKTYTGNGSTAHAITGVGFQPDWVWCKARSITKDHLLFDVIRGVTNAIKTNSNASTDTNSEFLQAFGTDGFTIGNQGKINTNSATYVSWNWKAGNSQGTSNTDGSINTTYTSANTTAGFSISTWTGTGANGTIGHGLGAKPEMIIVKNYSASQNWCVYHSGLSGTEGHKTLYLDLTQAEADQAGLWNDTAATSSVFSVGTNTNTNGSSASMLAYCFAEKPGYSKLGSYVGNGNVDGPFIYTGFKPALIIIKSTGYSENWFIFDNKRPGYNLNANHLNPNSNTTETASSANTMDILSNGFKMKATNNGINRSGDTFIYAAFGQSLVGSNNIPCTAR